MISIAIERPDLWEEKLNQEKEFLIKKYEELSKKRGILLLGPMDSNRIDRIFELSDKFPNMEIFTIGEYDKEQVVLRYTPKFHERIDVKEYVTLANEEYRNGLYEECINDFLQLLMVLHEPKAYIYAKLGLSYMKLSNTSLAIDYLVVATELAKEENINYDFTDLIAKLKGEISLEDFKPRFNVNIENFNLHNNSNFFGINNFLEINNYILESGLDVESACLKLDLDLDVINIIKLIYAREYYRRGDYKQGNLFLLDVEKKKNKSAKVMRILNEVRKNKRFYQNRPIEQDITLTIKK